MTRGLAITLLAALAASANTALAWTTPIYVSNTGTNYGLIPRVAPGFGGKLYLSWHQVGWGIYFRERSAGGTWGSITTLRNNSNWAADTTVTEDGAYRPHVAYTEADGAGARYLIHQYRSNAVNNTWVRTVLSSGNEESCPRMDTDGSGRVHLVYAKGSNNQHYLYHRIWTNGTWSSDLAVGSGAIESGRVGYHRPDLQAKGSIVHMAWIEPGGDRYVVRYKRYNGSSWSTTKTIGQSVGYTWMAGCCMAATDDNTIVAAWNQEVTAGGASKIYYAVSTDGGNTWAASQQFAGSETTPQSMYGRGGRAYMLTVTNCVNLRTWTNGAWDAGVPVNPGQSPGAGSWPDVTQTVDGAMHVVYYGGSSSTSAGVNYVMQPMSSSTGTVSGRVIDSVGPVPYATVTSSLGGETASAYDGTFTLTCPAGTATVVVSLLGYNNTDIPNVVVTAGQNTAVGDVMLTGVAPMSPNSSLVVTPGNTQVQLTWQNSPSLNFSGTLIVYRTDRLPTSPTDGTVAIDKARAYGAADGYTHTGLTNGTRLYYALYAHDNHPIRTYASAITGSATPAVQIDNDRDGDVDQADFGWYQNCLTGPYVAQTDPGCAAAMLDNDNDVDQDDVTLFQACLSGPGTLANPACLP